jgi:hypothetical protein
LDKTLLGLQQPIKASDLNDEALKRYFDTAKRPILFAPFSTMRFKKKKSEEDELKPNEPTS